MNRSYSLKKIVNNSLGLIILLIFAMACFRDSKFDGNDDVPRRTPTQTKTPDGASPTPSASATANGDSKTNTNNSNSQKTMSYQDNLPVGFRVPDDSVGKRIVTDYGAVYVVKSGVSIPPKALYDNEDECSKWQATVKTSSVQMDSKGMVLQEAAMKELQAAIDEAGQSGATISSNGPESARRTFADTVRLWKSRVDPGLDHWVKAGKITRDDVARIRALSPVAQISEILKLEEQGIYFSKDLTKSILYSVSAPGASQHLWMLAFDVKEHANPKVHEIMARHFWYQTVISDLPHFTFLGVAESDLPKLGLKKVSNGDRTYWVPSL